VQEKRELKDYADRVTRELRRRVRRSPSGDAQDEATEIYKKYPKVYHFISATNQNAALLPNISSGNLMPSVDFWDEATLTIRAGPWHGFCVNYNELSAISLEYHA
jgi:hypothetical protein